MVVVCKDMYCTGIARQTKSTKTIVAQVAIPGRHRSRRLPSYSSSLSAVHRFRLYLISLLVGFVRHVIVPRADVFFVVVALLPVVAAS